MTRAPTESRTPEQARPAVAPPTEPAPARRDRRGGRWGAFFAGAIVGAAIALGGVALAWWFWPSGADARSAESVDRRLEGAPGPDNRVTSFDGAQAPSPGRAPR